MSHEFCIWGTSLSSLKGLVTYLCSRRLRNAGGDCLVFLLLLFSPAPGGKLHLKLLSACIRLDIPRLSSLHLKIAEGNPPEIKAIHLQSAA